MLLFKLKCAIGFDKLGKSCFPVVFDENPNCVEPS